MDLEPALRLAAAARLHRVGPGPDRSSSRTTSRASRWVRPWPTTRRRSTPPSPRAAPRSSTRSRAASRSARRRPRSTPTSPTWPTAGSPTSRSPTSSGAASRRTRRRSRSCPTGSTAWSSRQPKIGLTELGTAAARALARERVLVDITHMSEQAIADTFAARRAAGAGHRLAHGVPLRQALLQPHRRRHPRGRAPRRGDGRHRLHALHARRPAPHPQGQDLRGQHGARLRAHRPHRAGHRLARPRGDRHRPRRLDQAGAPGPRAPRAHALRAGRPGHEVRCRRWPRRSPAATCSRSCGAPGASRWAARCSSGGSRTSPRCSWRRGC